MSENRIKKIMELLFIFIIPLLIMMVSIKFTKTTTYDSNNNPTEETRIIEYDNQLFVEEINGELTSWGKIKGIFTEYLNIQNEVILDVIMTYTVLWIMMFLIWHILYGLFELMFHILPNGRIRC